MVLRFGRSLFRKIVQNKLDIFVHINIDTVNCFNEFKMTVPLSIMILLAAIILMLYKKNRPHARAVSLKCDSQYYSISFPMERQRGTLRV